MTRWHHEIFRAMPRGRALLATEIYRRASLPKGWNARDVSEAMKLFVKQGAVEVERSYLFPSKTINAYRRIA